MDRSAILLCLRIVCLLPTFAIVGIATWLSGLVAFHSTGWPLAALFVAIGFACEIAVLRWGISQRTKVIATIVPSVVLIVLVALLLPAIQRPRCEENRMRCSNHLKQIIFAAHNYHDTFKTFPSAYIPDSQGNPIHSWRVLLLPYVEGVDGSMGYDFGSAWNSGKNLPLSAASPKFYRCPKGKSPVSDTDYLAVVGIETIWPGNEPMALRDILDGSSNTIAVVESHQTGIKWTEPRDLAFSNMDWQINGNATGSNISSTHPGGAMIALADGSVRFISEKMDQEVLR
ncbi:MAG: DUF1559 domain-containing protein, partial [Planctomycetota bacterium]